MNQELKFSLDVAQLVMLAGLVWGLAKMSAAVDEMRKVTTRLTMGLETLGTTLANVITRVAILEDRADERRDRRHDDVR